MSEKLLEEYNALNNAIKDHDTVVHARWDASYEAWMDGDCTRQCPFETEDD
jgi:hypothetical protein